MIVVSDTGPIQYLVLVGLVDFIPILYDALVIPHAVFEELDRSETPPTLREWISNFPDWANVRHPAQVEELPYGLGKGETEAIALATELSAPLLLDDQDARRVALSKSIPTTGTLGVLLAAHRQGHLDIQTSLNRLEQTNFRMSPALRNEVLRLAHVDS